MFFETKSSFKHFSVVSCSFQRSLSESQVDGPTSEDVGYPFHHQASREKAAMATNGIRMYVSSKNSDGGIYGGHRLYMFFLQNKDHSRKPPPVSASSWSPFQQIKVRLDQKGLKRNYKSKHVSKWTSHISLWPGSSHVTMFVPVV